MTLQTNKYFLGFRRVLYDSGVFVGEYGKVFRYNNEILLIYAVWQIKPVWWQIASAIVGALVISAIIGRLLVRWGFVKTDTTISNEQNPEISKLVKDVEKIIKHLGI